MKSKILLFLVLFTTGNVYAQIAQWLIPASYNELRLNDDLGLIITDSINKTIIWDLDGRRLAETTDTLTPFSGNNAVTIKPGTDLITGFLNKNGTFTSFSGYRLAYKNTSFVNDYLLVKNDNYYRFVDASGNLAEGKYIKAYPFSNGYAMCYTYKDFEKSKDPYLLLLKEDNTRAFFSFDGKRINDDDIEFVSSVNDEGFAVVIAKQKVYMYYGDEKPLSPVFANEGETTIKNQAKIKTAFSMSALMESKGKKKITASCGKDDDVTFTFDEFFVPESIIINGKETKYKRKAIVPHAHSSSLIITSDGNKKGLSYGLDDLEVLPPQFDNVETCIDDKAIINLSGKYGMLKVLKDKHFSLSMNKGNDIPFKHQKYETVVRLDIPAEVSSANTRIEIDPKTGCDIDRTSKESKDTEEGNYVQYDCVLNIPNFLPDVVSEIPYPAHVLYDGLMSPEIPFKVRAWHYKYFTIDPIESQTTISDGALSFTFNINADRSIGDDVYPMYVYISVEDTLQTEIEKLSETRYKCKVFPLNEGTNNFVVQVIEQGCPPVSFPYEVTYTKPNARNRKENVVLKKKPDTTSNSSSEPDELI